MKWSVMLIMACWLSGCAAPRSFVHRHVEIPACNGAVVHLANDEGSFSEAIASWNLLSRDSEDPKLRWRVGRRQAQVMQWTSWSPLNSTVRETSSEFATFEIDVISGCFDAIELKAEDGAIPTGFISLTATASNRGTPISRSRGTQVEIDVPHRSQKTDDASLKGRLCSPASLSMICAFYGESIDVGTLAQEAYDSAHDLYGNWPRNLQAVHRLTQGRLRARFIRMSSFDELRATLERGIPVVISVKGSIGGAPYSPTAGHLLVVRGMTANGDIMVVDPAFADSTQAHRIYGATDLAQAWLVNRRGSAYVVTRESRP